MKKSNKWKRLWEALKREQKKFKPGRNNNDCGCENFKPHHHTECINPEKGPTSKK